MTMTTEIGKRERRRRESYEIESVTKALQVLEALEGIAFEPVTISTIVGRTGLTKNGVFRALKTLEMRGYAICQGEKWTVGKRLTRLAISLSRKGDI